MPTALRATGSTSWPGAILSFARTNPCATADSTARTRSSVGIRPKTAPPGTRRACGLVRVTTGSKASMRLLSCANKGALRKLCKIALAIALRQRLCVERHSALARKHLRRIVRLKLHDRRGAYAARNVGFARILLVGDFRLDHATAIGSPRRSAATTACAHNLPVQIPERRLERSARQRMFMARSGIPRAHL